MGKTRTITPLRAIRSYCVRCKGQRKSLKCADECELWVYRDGHNPKRKGIGGSTNGFKRT